ncbi:TetR family transcriptional regulator [Nocardioides alcanivorans]|uniref:TetR family transcriptional regulator n=1 Tax=Nocardioides alcanivorans TaxID=2897352 RepID=UPI001F40F0CC|nr:TetR family transcriptional regulator [Nocardioides alcanivorans]
MPRIAERREPAEPVSADQQLRYRRILRAAARLGAEHGHERMQMNDVAKEAGVAIATLYRYFPSKNDLFLGLMRSQVRVLSPATVADDGLPPSKAVAKTLVSATNGLLQAPLLASAMLQANNAAQHQSGSEGSDVSNAFHHLVLRSLGIDDPTPQDLRMVRLVEQAWYGALVSVLNDVITYEECVEDIDVICELLLSPTYDEPRDAGDCKE